MFPDILITDGRRCIITFLRISAPVFLNLHETEASVCSAVYQRGLRWREGGSGEWGWGCWRDSAEEDIKWNLGVNNWHLVRHRDRKLSLPIKPDPDLYIPTWTGPGESPLIRYRFTQRCSPGCGSCLRWWPLSSTGENNESTQNSLPVHVVLNLLKVANDKSQRRPCPCPCPPPIPNTQSFGIKLNSYQIYSYFVNLWFI